MENAITEKPAYEFDGISIGYSFYPALGDSIIAKKVFEAIAQVEPNCRIDILCRDDKSRVYAKAFYSGHKNLNQILNASNVNLKNYDLVLNFSWDIFLNSVSERLQRLSPALFQSIVKIDMYNKKYIYNRDAASRFLFNMARSRILKTNCYTILACDGALPIYDNKVEIKLSPEWKGEFEKLGLKKYITIGSNDINHTRHLVKQWPTRYYVEFISLLKSKMPDITVVQTGGNGVIEIENADKKLLGTDLELTKYILKNSLLHIDCEGGPVHLASQLGTKCIAFFGATDVQYYGFSQNINLVSEICNPCYFVWESNDKCLLGGKEPLCMLSITPQQVFDVAYRYLKSLE